MELSDPARVFYDRTIDHMERHRRLELRLSAASGEGERVEIQQYLGDTERMIGEGRDGWGAGDPPDHARDVIMRRALEQAASCVRRDPVRNVFLEALLVSALVDGWQLNAPGGSAQPNVSLRVAGWDPQPGRTDLVLSTLGDPRPTAIAELKVLEVGDSLWDLIKLVSVLESDPTLVRAYLVVATTPRRWVRSEVAALFAPPDETNAGVKDWEVRDLLARWPRAWRNLLGGGTGRPRDVPGHIRTTFLGAHQVTTFPEYELRCIAVEPVETQHRLKFSQDGWPSNESIRGAHRLGLKYLLEAHLAARRYRNAHPDLRDYHQSRASAAARAFGIQLEDPPDRSDVGLATLLHATLNAIASVSSPFDGFLEAPRSVADLHGAHGARIREANAAVRESLLALARDVVVSSWNVEWEATIGTEDLVANGFDPTSPAPDPDDYC